ncbi:MAG: PRC-barrel domain-containing protein [Alphaproteobacteria bacterium]
MTKNLLLGSALAMFLAGPALAQTTPPATTDTPPAATERAPGTGAAGTGAAGTGAAGTGATGTGATGTTTTTTGTATRAPGMTDTDRPAATTQAPRATTDMRTASGPFLDRQEANHLRADEIIGTTVRNPQDENVGSISDLVLDENGQIIGAIVSVGGFLGIGAKSVGVDWNELQVRSSDSIVVKWTKEELEAAPEFRKRDDVRRDQERAARDTRTPAGGMGAPAPAR